MSFKKWIKEDWQNLPAVIIIAAVVVIGIVYGYTSEAAKQTHLVLHLVGTACYVGAVYVAVRVFRDDWEAGKWTPAVILALFAAGVTLNVIQGV